MKRKIIIGIICVGIIGTLGFRVFKIQQGDESVSITEAAIPVETVTLANQEIEDVLNYQGVIASKTTEKISFKSSARLDFIAGEVGDIVEEGTLLIQLETEDLLLAAEAADQQYNAAAANYSLALSGASDKDIELATLNVEKAEEYKLFLAEQVDNYTALYQEGIGSQTELDQIVLEYNIAQTDYNLAVTSLEKAESGADQETIDAARAQMDLAAVDIDLQESMIQDASYVAEREMVIVETLYEQGELVPSGYPVAILRSIDQIVEIGVSSKDIDSIVLGQRVEVTSDNQTVEGEISRISEVPDSEHFLYEIEVLVLEPEFKIGEIVTCNIIKGTEVAMLVPLSTIKKDSFDYVYVANDNIVAIQKVEIVGTYGEYAIIEGVEEGTDLIISNLNKIKQQSLINVVEE